MAIPFRYDEQVYNQLDAAEMLPFIFELFNPKSILDVGCGLGTWLNEAKELGIKDIFGIDGTANGIENPGIEAKEFAQINLSSPFDLNRKFDILLSLEVGEHLPESSANGFINSLCKHADIIIFSAAVPGQGGQDHINEQWPDYWIGKFSENGYQVFDIFRERFWNNRKVKWWYKQNMFLYVKRSIVENFPFLHEKNVLPCIHPELFEWKCRQLVETKDYWERRQSNPGIMSSGKLLVKALRRKLGL